MVINEGMHSCSQITPFSSEWKLRTFLDLSVQAVKGHKEGRGGKISTKKNDLVKKCKSIQQQLTVTASLQAGVNEQHRQTVLFSKRQIYS